MSRRDATACEKNQWSNDKEGFYKLKMYSLLHHSKIYLVNAPAMANRHINIMLFWIRQQTNIEMSVTSLRRVAISRTQRKKTAKYFFYIHNTEFVTYLWHITFALLSLRFMNATEINDLCDLLQRNAKLVHFAVESFEDQLRIKWLFFGIQTRSFAYKLLIIRFSRRDRLSLHVRFASDAMFKAETFL